MENHLHRYLAEFDFRYNHRSALGVNDAQQADAALKAIPGKRLTYLIEGLLKHTSKSRSRELYEAVKATLREIDWNWHQDDEEPINYI